MKGEVIPCSKTNALGVTRVKLETSLFFFSLFFSVLMALYDLHILEVTIGKGVYHPLGCFTTPSSFISVEIPLGDESCYLFIVKQMSRLIMIISNLQHNEEI